MKQTIVTADVIDIGSNSIRYLHAAVTPLGITAVERKSLITTRLAQGLDTAGELGVEPMHRSLDAVRAFAAISREKATPFLFAYATSAVRDAKNGSAFCERVQRETGIRIDVLPGEQEAHLAYIGAVGRARGGLIDIGGGSAQIMTAEDAYSFPIGCVRVKDRFSTLQELLLGLPAWLDERLQPFPAIRQPRWTGVGGTITTFAALQAGLQDYDPAAVSREIITPEGLDGLLGRLDELGDGRRSHPLLKDRHDVILQGGSVLRELMRRLAIQQLCVSDSDGMEGYLLAQTDRILN
jgi:exopolyphosphatase/guanosine-5'-triphosphate,3'-diphosphate pyrophosphatase